MSTVSLALISTANGGKTSLPSCFTSGLNVSVFFLNVTPQCLFSRLTSLISVATSLILPPDRALARAIPVFLMYTSEEGERQCVTCQVPNGVKNVKIKICTLWTSIGLIKFVRDPLSGRRGKDKIPGRASPRLFCQDVKTSFVEFTRQKGGLRGNSLRVARLAIQFYETSGYSVMWQSLYSVVSRPAVYAV